MIVDRRGPQTRSRAPARVLGGWTCPPANTSRLSTLHPAARRRKPPCGQRVLAEVGPYNAALGLPASGVFVKQIGTKTLEELWCHHAHLAAQQPSNDGTDHGDA